MPNATNGRGLAEAGVLPNAGPGFAATERPAATPRRSPPAAREGELTALYLLHCDPLRDLPHRSRWERALDKATTVIAHAQFLTEGLLEHATVVFPAESYAEKEGTMTHPDGRVQRLRTAIGHQGDTQPEWWVPRRALPAPRAGAGRHHRPRRLPAALRRDPVPRGAHPRRDRREGRPLARAERRRVPRGRAERAGRRRLGARRRPERRAAARYLQVDLGAPEVERSPALKFLHPRQRLEMAPADAARLGLAHGDRVTVGSDGAAVSATVTLRNASPTGSVFLEDGIPSDAANVLDGPLVDIRKA